MVEASKTPETEELLARIAQLERETARLRAEIDDMGRAFLKELDDKVEASRADAQFAQDYIWPLIHKVFPGYLETMKRIDGILKRRPAAEEKKN
jgi:hypothetical protein